MRWARRIVAVVVVVVIGGGAIVALTARPELDDARDEAEEQWDAVAPPLATRYQALGALWAAVGAAGGEERAVVGALGRTLETWDRVKNDGAPAAVRAANDLEGQARRLLGVIAASERLDGDAAVEAAREAFADTRIPESARLYNQAVSAYEDKREGVVRRLVIGILDYDSFPVLDIGSSEAA